MGYSEARDIEMIHSTNDLATRRLDALRIIYLVVGISRDMAFYRRQDMMKSDCSFETTRQRDKETTR